LLQSLLGFPIAELNKKKDELRFLEISAHYIHFTTINGIKTNVDQDTVKFLKNVLGPVLVFEVFYTPLFSPLLEQLSDLGIW
jgi:hypothetical protein